MSVNIFKIGVLSFIFSSALFFTSCQKEVLTEGITTDSAEKQAQIDVATDELDAVVEETFLIQEGIVNRTGETYEASGSIPTCATYTIVMSGMVRTVTLDFGTGCDMPNGNHLAGVVKIVYEHNPTAQSMKITYTLTNFSFNYVTFNGGGTIVRVKNNANNHPQCTITFDVTAVFPDGKSAHRKGTKVREWIEGFETKDWKDNVYLVTGNWTTEFNNGVVNKGFVIKPLRRVATCPFFVSGAIELSHNGNVGKLFFGNGTCDDVAVFVGPDGKEIIIKLKK